MTHSFKLLSPAQDETRHVRSVEFFCHSRARVWRAREIRNSAGGRGEGPGFFARQPRARMTEQELEQDGTVAMICRDSIRSLARLLAGIGQPALSEDPSPAGWSEGQPLSEDPSPACGRGEAARRLLSFCNRRDARVRVQRGFGVPGGFYFFSEFLTQDTSEGKQVVYRLVGSLGTAAGRRDDRSCVELEVRGARSARDSAMSEIMTPPARGGR